MTDAVLQDGTVLRFPDETPDDVIQSAVKKYLADQMEVEKPVDPLVETAGHNFPVVGPFAQGVSFGFSDEIMGALRAPFLAATEGIGLRQAYTRARDAEREALAMIEADQPLLSMAGEMGGAVATGVRAIPSAAVNAPTLVGRVARAAGVGGAEGAVYGAGQAQELADVPEQAAQGAMVGAAAGGALQPVGEAVTRFIPGAGREAAAQASGTRAVQRAIARDSMTPEQVATRLERATAGGAPVTVADVGGQNVRRLAEASGQIPGRGAQTATRTVTSRQPGQARRLEEGLRNLTGIGAQRGRAVLDDTINARNLEAAQLFEPLKQLTAENIPELQDAFDAAIATPAGRKIYRKVLDGFANREQITAEQAGKLPLMGRLHNWQSRMAEEARRLRANMKGSDAGDVEAARQSVLEVIDPLVPEYRAAREAFRQATEFKESVEAGAKDFLRQSADDVAANFKALSATEQAAYRVGAVQSILDKMSQQRRMADIAQVFDRAGMQEKLRTIGVSQRKFREFIRDLAIERRISSTKQAVMGGSPTQPRMEAARDLGTGAAASDELLEGMGSAVASGNLLAMLTGASIRTGLRRGREFATPGRAGAAADILFSSDPAVLRTLTSRPPLPRTSIAPAAAAAASSQRQ